MMRADDYRTLNLKRLKKDGSISPEYVNYISRALKGGEIFVMPVDSIYGVIGLYDNNTLCKISELSGDSEDNCEIIISNFKMLENMALVDKYVYDFLKRIWPGEVIVQLKNRNCMHKSNILMRMPKHKYILDIVNRVGHPLIYMPAKTSVRKMIYNDKDLLRRFRSKCSILMINEFNKSHTSPTLIDISCEKLTILNEGRVCSDEIKSLFFLGDL